MIASHFLIDRTLTFKTDTISNCSQHTSAFIMTVLIQLLIMMTLISNGEHLPLVHVAIYMAGVKKKEK